MGFEKGRYRGEEIDIADARMMLSNDELAELEVTLDDGTVARPFRPYPTTGTLRGEVVDLEIAAATFNEDDLTQVVVDVPGIGPIRPWRFCASGRFPLGISFPDGTKI
jgi:hypothetical protein